MDMSKNFFEFFGLPVSYQVDLPLLSQRYRELQRQLHPDRHAHLSAREQRLSVQYTAFLNEGLTTLKAPLSRAQYLLLLQGVDTRTEVSVTMEPMFLMRQMVLREGLDEAAAAADPFAALEVLADEVQAELGEMRRQFEQQFGAAQYEAAATTVRKMQFLEKLVVEIENLERRLDE